MVSKVFNKKVDEILYWIMTACTFIYGAAYALFFEHDHMLSVLVVLSAYIVYRAIYKGCLNFDFNVLFIFALYMFGACRDLGFVDFDFIQRTIIPVLVYMCGKLIVGDDNKQANKRILATTVIMGIGMFTQALLDLSVNLRLDELQTENWNRFWTGSDQARTLYDYEFIVITSLAFVSIVFFKKNKKLFSLLILLNIAVIVIDVLVEGRYNLGLLVGDFILLPFVFFLENWSSYKESTRKRIKISVGTIVAIVVVFGIAFKTNFLGLHDLYDNSYLSGSGGIIHNVRIQIAIDGWKMLMANPDTGFIMPNYGAIMNTTHNTYLEFGREFGLFGFSMIAIYELLVLKDSFLLALKKGEDNWIKYILIALTVNNFVYFFLEPSGHRYYHILMITFFFHGMQRAKLELLNTKEVKWPDLKRMNFE